MGNSFLCFSSQDLAHVKGVLQNEEKLLSEENIMISDVNATADEEDEISPERSYPGDIESENSISKDDSDDSNVECIVHKNSISDISTADEEENTSNGSALRTSIEVATGLNEENQEQSDDIES